MFLTVIHSCRPLGLPVPNRAWTSLATGMPGKDESQISREIEGTHSTLRWSARAGIQNPRESGILADRRGSRTGAKALACRYYPVALEILSAYTSYLRNMPASAALPLRVA